MKIFRLLNHVARENTYLLVNDQAIIVVDPGSNTDKIKEVMTLGMKNKIEGEGIIFK